MSGLVICSPFKIRLVITQSFYDERIKNSSNIDGISLTMSPFRAECWHHG